MKKFNIIMILLYLLFNNLYAQNLNIYQRYKLHQEKNQLITQKRELQNELDNLIFEVKNYIMEHKIATVCLLAAGIETISYLRNEEFTNDERIQNLFNMVVVFCVPYSLANFEEISRVTTKLGQYGVKYDTLTERIERIENRITEINRELND